MPQKSVPSSPVPTSGDDVFRISNQTINGWNPLKTLPANTAYSLDSLAGSDSFIFNAVPKFALTLEGSTNPSAIDPVTDAVVNVAYYSKPTDATVRISTQQSSLGIANATDTLQFNKSGNYSAIDFRHIEQIKLAKGVTAVFSSEQLSNAIGTLDYTFTNANNKVVTLNPGLHFSGVVGDAIEKVKVVVDYSDLTFTPASTVVGATATTYVMGDFQLDDATVANLFTDVKAIYDFKTNSTEDSYARADGSNNDEIVQGSHGVDNATMRMGDDVYYGNGGNDVLVGAQGADWLNGGTGNDVFLITGFETGVFGIPGKTDDGSKEWLAEGAKHDVIIGGIDIDTLRITNGAVDADKGKVILTADNFKGMERVEIGTTVARLNVEDTALQMKNAHYTLNVGETQAVQTKIGGLDGSQTVLLNFDNVSVDASTVKNALTFVGNGNKNTFIGTTKNDTFIGNDGDDVLTGGAGKDIFVFDKVHTQTVTGAATTVQSYTDIVTALTGVDTITDFTTGKDVIKLGIVQFSSLSTLTTDNLVQGAGAVALDSNDYLVFNTDTQTLSYDADGNGTAAAVDIVILTGVSSLSIHSFVLG